MACGWLLARNRYNAGNETARGKAMAEELFNLIFRGDLVAGFSLADVKAGFAQLFRLDPTRVDPYFLGKPTILKKDCDRATADKFQLAMQRIGAVLEVRPVAAVAPAATPAATVSTPAAAAPVQSAVAAAPAGNPWSLAAQGSNLIRHDEIARPAPVQVDISKISLVKRNPFALDEEEPLEPARHVEAPRLDLSGLTLGKPGESLAEYQEFVPRQLDLSELSLAAVGADVLRPEERVAVAPVQVDTSELNLAAAGGDLGQIPPPPAPPAPSTEHLSVQK